MQTEANLVSLSADIVSAYVSNNNIQAGEIAPLLSGMHAALVNIGKPPPEPIKYEPPVPINKTIKGNHIISLEDGKPYKSLKRHLTGRGLTPDQYRQKWGLRPDYPMVAPEYSKRRSELALALGLGRKAAKEPAEAAPEPKARKRKSAPKSAPKAAPKGSVKRSKRKS
jgi:predicted transcriptional regulator